ncbi:six-hairpin glycosidase-like protein [Diaporthe eres]|uniref:Six-hairpin glycosidase n=1 Tax=Diaporthe vaccinii TaxID=105482 RepID=A0ABR4E7T9_9PEZI|nr:six-hairpin glycosidase-like protein [Diaporthe eres]
MTSELISKVIMQGRLLASHSWEYGALSEALLEWYNPEFSVFGKDAFPDGKIPILQVGDIQSLSYAEPDIRTNSTTLIDGDGAAGDPASLGVPAILIGQTQSEHLSAAERQVNHLLDNVPRWSNGAISHRESNVELWADFIYMVPPTLAYWAVQTNNITLLNEAIQQCNLYHDVLSVPANESGNDIPWDAAGLWQHIIGPTDGNNDYGIWSTGNAWAAAGMSRVLATAKNSRLEANILLLERLEDSIKGILNGAIALDDAEPDEPLLRNYLNDTTWFAELAGTSLLAATAYRVVQLEPARFGEKYAAWADAKREAVITMIGSDGLLAPVVNPLNWNDRTPATKSPEAQSFAILLFSAYRDFQSS